MPSLDVHLNRDHPRAIDAPAAFSARGSFEVHLRNHGEGSHAHLQFDDALAVAAPPDDGTAFVPAGETERVPIEVGPVEEEITGTLTISTGYGAEKAAVEVTLAPETDEAVDVDESLSRPRREEPDDDGGLADLPGFEEADLQTASLLALGGLAILVAVAAAVAVRSAVVTAAAFVVVGAVVAALALSIR